MNQMRFLRSSALAKAPKLRLAASCSAADTIVRLPPEPGVIAGPARHASLSTRLMVRGPIATHATGHLPVSPANVHAAREQA